jgi:hypothetical protein
MTSFISNKIRIGARPGYPENAVENVQKLSSLYCTVHKELWANSGQIKPTNFGYENFQII